MEDNNKQDLAAVVRQEMKNVQDTLKTHVSDEIAKKYADTETKLKEIREELSKKAVSGESPKAEKVQDLEERLIEAEKNIQAFALRANTAVNGSAQSQEERDTALFKGVFVKDAREFVQRVRELNANSMPGAAARAIDTGLFADGGKLSAETADRFIDYIIREEAALSRVQTRRMSNPQAHIDRLTVSNRVLRKAAEGVAPTVADAIGTARRTLTTVETIWAEDLTLTFLEDNIEMKGAEAHIARILATKFGAELNDLAWNGDESENSGASNWNEINESWFGLADATLGQQEGATAAAVSSLTTAAAVMNAMLIALPDDYGGLPDLAYFFPRQFCQNYADEVSARQTALGDQVLVNGMAVLRYFGYPVIPERHLYLLTSDRGMFTSLSNLVHGIQRQITVDSMWQPRTRLVEYTLTARNDYEFATPHAIVTADSIPTTLTT